jgi:ribosome-associated protein
LEPLSSLKDRKKSPTQLTRSSKIFKTIIAAIQDKKGEHIISLDLRKVHEAVADFFIICEANNAPQLKAIIDNIDYEVKTKCDELPYKTEGKTAALWILIDCILTLESSTNWKKCGATRIANYMTSKLIFTLLVYIST